LFASKQMKRFKHWSNGYFASKVSTTPCSYRTATPGVSTEQNLVVRKAGLVKYNRLRIMNITKWEYAQ
jgi:hypothetical protein